MSINIIARRLAAFYSLAVLKTMRAVETFSLQGTLLEMFCNLNANVYIRLLILASIGPLSQLLYL